MGLRPVSALAFRLAYSLRYSAARAVDSSRAVAQSFGIPEAGVLHE